MIPPVSGVGAQSLLKLGSPSPTEGAAGEPALFQAGSPSAPLEGTSGAGSPGGVGAIGEPPSFGGELTKAISSLEQSQQSAAGAAQGLAMGTSSDPESAVVTVEDAQLEMQLASQIRTKATEAAQSIFQTQV